MNPHAGRPKDWGDIEAASSPEKLLAFLDAAAALPAIAEAKRRSFELLDARPGSRLLDAGCGTGMDVLDLVKSVLPGGEVVGIDSSAAAIKMAHENARGRAGVRFERADLVDLPFADASFDAVRADRTLQHVARPELAVRELVRVIRPGGPVVITEATVDRLGDRGNSTRRTRAGKGLMAFLPLLLSRSGVRQIRLEHSEGVVENPGRDVLDVLELSAGPINIRVVHIVGIAGAS